MVYLILLSAMFSSTMLFTGYSLGDLFGSLIIMIALFRYKFSFRFLSPKNHKNMAMFIFWALFNGILIYFLGMLDVAEFSKSMVKLNFYALAYFSAYTLLREIEIEKIYKQVSTVIFANAVIAIYIYVAMHMNLPYEFFWIGLQAPETAAYFAGSLFVRARGLFTEPAILGYFLVMGQAFLLLNDYKLSKIKNLITWVAVLLTFSVTTYFLAGLVILMAYRKNLKRIAKLGVVTLLFLGFLYFIPGLREPIQVAVIDRVVTVLAGSDQGISSANTRLNTTWDIAYDNLQESYLLGSGLGNHDLSYARMNRLNAETVIETHNVLAYVLGTTGVIGFILFLSLFNVFRNNKVLGLIFFASLFVNGYFLSPLFWVFYCLFSLDRKNYARDEFTPAKENKKYKSGKKLSMSVNN